MTFTLLQPSKEDEKYAIVLPSVRVRLDWLSWRHNILQGQPDVTKNENFKALADLLCKQLLWDQKTAIRDLSCSQKYLEVAVTGLLGRPSGEKRRQFDDFTE